MDQGSNVVINNIIGMELLHWPSDHLQKWNEEGKARGGKLLDN